MRSAPARSPGVRSVISDRRTSTVTAPRRRRERLRQAPAASASRSCTTQCCGPGRRGASQRPIAPLPPPRSWITSRPAAGRYWRRRSASSAERAAASAGSRRTSHPGLTRTAVALIVLLPRRRRRPPLSSQLPRGRRRRRTRSPSHGRSVARRSRAARRRRSRSSASSSQARSAALSAAGSPGGTSSPGRVPSSPCPRASVTPPTSVARTGRPRARASVTTMPYVSACEASTSRSAAAYARSSSGPERGPGKRTRSPSPLFHARRRTPSANAGSRTRLPTHVQRQDRSIASASPSSSTSCPLSGVKAATQSSASPAAVPCARQAASTPGSVTCTRSAGSAYSSPSRRRVHALVVTTAAAAPRTSRSRARTAPASSSGGRWPSGMCTSTTCRSRRANGTSVSGAVDAISPSSSTTAPSGIRRMVRARAACPASSGHGQAPGTACSCTAQPSVASRRETRRSYVLPPLGHAGSSMPSGTTTWTSFTAAARSSPTRRGTRAASPPAHRALARRRPGRRSARGQRVGPR